MKNLFRRILGRTAPTPPPSRPPASLRDNPATIEDGSENATRRQLVQVLLRDVLRRSGIPADWIECQMLLVSSRTRGNGMYVRLVLKHWDHRLMNYTVAFQSALMTEIERFEPRASDWLHGISWQMNMDDSCPYIELPEKSFWQPNSKSPFITPTLPRAMAGDVHPPAALQRRERAARPNPPAPDVDENDPTLDLERLFAIRDQELDRQAANGLIPVGYEKTQPASL